MSRNLKHVDKKGVPLIAYSNPQLPITEQFRQIRTNIQYSSVDIEIQSVMVTSPEPGDGKSTIAANLAIVLAQQGKHVLLVDTDLRKPSVHYAFNVSNQNGLTTVLTKETSLDEAIYNTDVPNLDILTSGPIPPNPSELLDSKAMEIRIKEMKNIFDYIVFDTPPVLAVTDAQILANKCDGVVMVVASKKTTKERAKKAKELLEKVKSRMIGVVVNGVNFKRDEYYGQYS